MEQKNNDTNGSPVKNQVVKHKGSSQLKIRQTTGIQSKKVKKNKQKSLNKNSRKHKVYHPKRYGNQFGNLTRHAGPKRYYGRKYYGPRYSPLFDQTLENEDPK